MRNYYSYEEYDYDDTYDYDNRSKYNKFFDDDDEEEEKQATKNIDSDLFPYIDDARISTKATTFKTKKKKQEKIFKIGDAVFYRNKEAVVVFGPYEKNYKQLYEIQTHDGKIVSATAAALRKI